MRRAGGRRAACSACGLSVWYAVSHHALLLPRCWLLVGWQALDAFMSVGVRSLWLSVPLATAFACSVVLPALPPRLKSWPMLEDLSLESRCSLPVRHPGIVGMQEPWHPPDLLPNDGRPSGEAHCGPSYLWAATCLPAYLRHSPLPACLPFLPVCSTSLR